MVFVSKSVESSLALMSSIDVLLKIKENSCAAVAIYDHLQLGKKLNLPGKHVNAVIVPKRENCGDPNHLSPKCPKPHDEEKCKKAREARKMQQNLREVKVAEDVEVEMAVEVVQVGDLVLMSSVLLGTVQQKATLLE